MTHEGTPRSNKGLGGLSNISENSDAAMNNSDIAYDGCFAPRWQASQSVAFRKTERTNIFECFALPICGA